MFSPLMKFLAIKQYCVDARITNFDTSERAFFNKTVNILKDNKDVVNKEYYSLEKEGEETDSSKYLLRA